MSSIFLLLQRVHELVHDFPMKPEFSEPKIFTGGVDANRWSSLSQKERKVALSKDWYVYYSFKNPKTGRLVRQTNIKGGANRYSDKQSRIHILKTIKRSLEILLSQGFNPYQDNTELEAQLKDSLSSKTKINYKSKTTTVNIENDFEVSIKLKDAFSLVLELKTKVMNESSFIKYRSRINRFNKWLLENSFTTNSDVSTITKKHIISYLNFVLSTSSSRNRNNTRTDLSSFFQCLKDNEIIEKNFVKEINIIKSIPKRNKTFTPKQQKDIFSFLDTENPVLLLYIKFLSYGFMRPIEICRLKVKDIDLKDRKIYIKAKNQPVKTKIIPDILFKDIPSLDHLDPDSILFSKFSLGQEWLVKEESRADYYSKQFRKVKIKFGLGSDYGLYSFRHTYISRAYRNLVRDKTPYETKSELMLITGHTSMSGLENYLRSIDAALPKDYSKLLE